MTRKKRKYTRLVASKWAELRGLWETGDHGLVELSDRYGVSPRAIQSHLKKLGSVKGAKAAEMAAVVQKEILREALGDQGTLVLRAKATREAAYTNTVIVEDLIMAQLALAQKDPTQAFKACNCGENARTRGGSIGAAARYQIARSWFGQGHSSC
jgi:hypothetical protein